MTFPPSPQPLADVQRVLAVFAHPDDVDFAAAGVVAQWVDSGLEVAYLVVTRGDAGGFDDTPRDQMPGIREAEQRAAAAAVGVKQIEFLSGYSDGAVYVTHELRRDITRAIRRFRPDRVLTTSPVRNWSSFAGASHPDHLAVGEATMCAIYPDARNPFAHPSLGLDPWTVREIWLMGAPGPDHVVDVTDVADRKIAALLSHVSQTAHEPGFEDFVRQWMSDNARRAGLGEDRLAEPFVIVSADHGI